MWITDFGLAKLTGQDDLTRSGDVIGTLRYLAPEALRGRTGPENDIYSLGLTLYELITLNSPFGDVSASELLRQVSESRPTRPRRLDPSIPRDLETIVLKATAPEPRDRYQSAMALADDLRCFVEDRPIRARRATMLERGIRWSRRNRAMAALTATAAAALLLAAIVGWVGYASTKEALRRSDRNVKLSLAVFGELFDKLSPDEGFFPPPTGRRDHRRRPPPGAFFKGGRPPGGEGEGGGPPPFAVGDGADAGPGRRPRGGEGGGPPVEVGDGADARRGDEPGRRGEGPGRRPDGGDLADRPGPGGRSMALVGPGGNPFAGGGPMGGEGMGPPGAGEAEEHSALLSSVLDFYEQFARENETNSRLEAEAARAYFKVGALFERLDRFEEAERAMGRSVAMFEGLVAKFPSAVEYQSKIVEIAIMTDPWSIDPSLMLPLERRLLRARELVDRLARENPQELGYVQSQIHVHAKLGAVMQRLDRPGDAENAYRRAIEFAGFLMERSGSPTRATIDRADVREALGLMVLEGGQRDVARGLLEGAVGDLRSLQGNRRVWPMLSERFTSLADGFRKLGDNERAEVVAGWSRPVGARPVRKSAGERRDGAWAERVRWGEAGGERARRGRGDSGGPGLRAGGDR